MQADFVNGVFDVAARGYRVKLIGGGPATLQRANVPSRLEKQFGMRGAWGSFPDVPAELHDAVVKFIDEQTRKTA